MRPPRIAILVLFVSASFFLVCRSISSIRRQGPAASSSPPPQKSTLRPFFSFTTPFSLFPPSASISLTDDNSTFFPARPAAFGPPLEANGLSGQLWIGVGFSEESLQDSEGEGELGCSDIPGWESGKPKLSLNAAKQGSATSKPGPIGINEKRPKTPDLATDAMVGQDAVQEKRRRAHSEVVDDGTDDHLHQGLQQTSRPYNGSPAASGSTHADIQSIQETAEITGKVVLLSRGGCGFLEKVKWAQRRGAIALIVGDNQKGGPLIQMFARGDVSNVTIPSVFTSRTTAHLLSSLMQPGSFNKAALNEKGDPRLKAQLSAKSGKVKDVKKAGVAARHTSSTLATSSSQDDAEHSSLKQTAARRSLFSRLFHPEYNQAIDTERSRPPSSGQLDWVLVDDRGKEKAGLVKNGLDKVGKDGAKGFTTKTSGDGFQIGVQDWRDPDLAGSTPEHDRTRSNGPGASARQVGKASNSRSEDTNGPKGGSITPGSGEYMPRAGNSASPASGQSGSSSESRRGFFSRIFGGEEEAGGGLGHASDEKQRSSATITTPISTTLGGNDAHDGLWVTITPTGSASPFFDTLLVLVISPLITLTVVYALLILRVKIRMRRWRAPKSVVDQLPVRTYHTVAPSPAETPRTPSPTSSSPTTPLLQGSSRSRPRSHTTTGVPDAEDLLTVHDALQTTRPPSPEKNTRGTSSQWKKYMGRQVECVVCLEEYVDGVSRVMSLPCGHEFHAECM